LVVVKNECSSTDASYGQELQGSARGNKRECTVWTKGSAGKESTVAFIKITEVLNDSTVRIDNLSLTNYEKGTTASRAFDNHLSFQFLAVGANSHALSLHGLASGIAALVISRTKIVRIAHQNTVRVTRLILQGTLGFSRHAVLY